MFRYEKAIHPEKLCAKTLTTLMPMTIIGAVISQLINLCIRVVPLLVIGIIGASALSELGLTRHFAFLARPLTRNGNLPDEAGVAITTCIASSSAGYAMLAGFYERGKLNERQVIVTTLMNSFFGSISHMIQYHIPVVLPILGMTAGLLYLGTRIGIALGITLFSVLLGRVFLEKPETWRFSPDEEDTRSNKEKVSQGVKASIPILLKVLPRLFIVYLIVITIMQLGWLDFISGIAEPTTGLVGLPGESAMVIATQIFEYTSGIIIAGTLLHKQILTPVQTVCALLLGGIISMSVMYVRHSLPSKIAYFGAKMGTKIAFYNLIVDLAFTSIVLVVLLQM